MLHKPNFFVLTGGPGVGKTALIRHLETLGERVVEETARAVIRQELASGGGGTPWLDNDRFVALCARRDTQIFDGLSGERARVFFDRGIMDSYGANGATPSAEVIDAVRTRRYSHTVFVLPPWPEIYGTDAERRQDWVEAEATFEIILRRLPTLGYEPLVVPQSSVADRAAFVLANAT